MRNPFFLFIQVVKEFVILLYWDIRWGEANNFEPIEKVINAYYDSITPFRKKKCRLQIAAISSEA